MIGMCLFHDLDDAVNFYEKILRNLIRKLYHIVGVRFANGDEYVNENFVQDETMLFLNRKLENTGFLCDREYRYLGRRFADIVIKASPQNNAFVFFEIKAGIRHNAPNIGRIVIDVLKLTYEKLEHPDHRCFFILIGTTKVIRHLFDERDLTLLPGRITSHSKKWQRLTFGQLRQMPGYFQYRIENDYVSDQLEIKIRPSRSMSYDDISCASWEIMI